MTSHYIFALPRTNMALTRLLGVIALCCLCFISDARLSDIRTWTSKTGTALDARFIRAEGAYIILRDPQDSELTIHYSDLSLGDQQFLQRQGITPEPPPHLREPVNPLDLMKPNPQIEAMKRISEMNTAARRAPRDHQPPQPPVSRPLRVQQDQQGDNHERLIRGVILLEKTPECDFFVIETSAHYVLVEWYGGVITVWEGDAVAGSLHTTGRQVIHVVGRGDMRVDIIGLTSTHGDAEDWFSAQCN